MKRSLLALALVLILTAVAWKVYTFTGRADKHQGCPMMKSGNMSMDAHSTMSEHSEEAHSAMSGHSGDGCCPGDMHTTASNEKKTVSAICPVMKNKIPDVSKAAGKSTYKGKTYYFCCDGCKPAFDKNSEKYVNKT